MTKNSANSGRSGAVRFGPNLDTDLEWWGLRDKNPAHVLDDDGTSTGLSE